MLTKLRLQNFKCFNDHELSFRPTTIIVGKNNAGKSTIVEALRLVSIIVNRYQSLNYSDVPNWLDIPRRSRGVSPSIKGMEFNFENVFHRYGDPPAIITATFNTLNTIDIYIGEDNKIHAVIKNSYKESITTKSQAKNIKLPQVNILPQVAPLARKEEILTPDYVRSAMSSPLSHLHFRNQLNLFYDAFQDDFKKIAEGTWPGLRILELDGKGKFPGDKLSLLVKDGDFVAEVGMMGHGLQMWLQTMWFLARVKKDSTVILDEPDVYMHADLQRRLIRLLMGRYQQNIIATHSTEIMAEVKADQVLVVDRKRSKSIFTTSLPGVQWVFDYIGSTHNIQLARLWTARRFLLVEGKDISLLKQIQNILFPDSHEPFDTIPNMSIGGWGGWNVAVGTSMVLKNAGGQEIITYCVLDSDYHTAEQIAERQKEAKRRGVQLHIWDRKEIENYLLVPAAIYRFILSCIESRIVLPNMNKIVGQINNIVENSKDAILDAIATEYFAQNKAGGLTSANRLARQKIEDAWKTEEGRFSIVSGKKVITELSKWSQSEFGVSISINSIVRELKTDEIPSEMATVVKEIEACKIFGRVEKERLG